MDRPVNPEPDECPKIRKAFRAARFFGWPALILMRLLILVALILCISSPWYYGVGLFVVGYCLLLTTEHFFARCPRCGRVWTSKDVDAFVCSRCRLNIGLGL